MIAMKPKSRWLCIKNLQNLIAYSCLSFYITLHLYGTKTAVFTFRTHDLALDYLNTVFKKQASIFTALPFIDWQIS